MKKKIKNLFELCLIFVLKILIITYIFAEDIQSVRKCMANMNYGQIFQTSCFVSCLLRKNFLIDVYQQVKGYD